MNNGNDYPHLVQRTDEIVDEMCCENRFSELEDAQMIEVLVAVYLSGAGTPLERTEVLLNKRNVAKILGEIGIASDLPSSYSDFRETMINAIELGYDRDVLLRPKLPK